MTFTGFWIFLSVVFLLAGIGTAYLFRTFCGWLISKIDDNNWTL